MGITVTLRVLVGRSLSAHSLFLEYKNQFSRNVVDLDTAA